MFNKIVSMTMVFLLIQITICISNNRVCADSAQKTRISDVEISLLSELGLSPDANDTQIIQLLDEPNKRTSSTLLIRYRKIYSATPKLLQIVNDPNIFPLARFGAAKALCDFGNKEWMPIIKKIAKDPNGLIAGRPYEIEVAGLFARAGDYSDFDTVAKGIQDKKWWVRHTAIVALGNFRHKTDPVTDRAVELLKQTATSDSDPRLRVFAVRSLDKITETKCDVAPILLKVLEANSNSADKNLRLECTGLLMKYRKVPEPEKTP